MVKCHGYPVPEGRLELFDKLLKQHNGRYTSNPVESPDQHGRWRVDFDMDGGCPHKRERSHENTTNS